MMRRRSLPFDRPAMAAAFLPVVLLLLHLLHPHVRADGDLPPASPELSSTCQDHHHQSSALSQELERAKQQLLDLERTLSEKDLVLHDKHKAVLSLQTELEKLKKEKSGDLDTALQTTRIELETLEAKVTLLEDELLKKGLELQGFKDRVKSLEAAETERASKIKQLEKTVSQQKDYIEKAERALHAAETTLLRVQEEADAKDRELIKVHGGWLPPWTQIRLVALQASTVDYWARYAKPHLTKASEKASGVLSTAQKWSKPHVDTAKTHVQQKLSPFLRQSVETVSATLGPHVSTAKGKVVDGYQASRDLIIPQIERVKDAVGPYWQVSKETCKPYVEAIAEHVRPHYEQVQAITHPYVEKAFESYRVFLTSATNIHNQLQHSVHEKMKDVDMLEPLASKELVWFLASALLVLPVMAIFVLFSSAFSPSKKPAKAAKAHGHSHKRPKRAKQVDK